MIEKIRRTLIIKYTIIIAFILFFGFIASYAAYRHTGIQLIYNSLTDYLSEELWEASKEMRRGIPEVEIHKIQSNIHSLHNFTYWFIDKKIIRAERHYNDELSALLEQRLLSKTYQSGKIYHENISVFHPQKQKWYFLVLKQDFKIDEKKHGEVFVLANYTPIRRNAKNYIKIAISSGLIVIVLAYFIGSFFASRAMKFMQQSYEKQKQFVSNAAHEFRTPLTILYSYTELLEYRPQEIKRITADMKDEIQQMSELVDRLLVIARYDNLSTLIHKEKFSLTQLVSQTLKPYTNLYPRGTFELINPDKNIFISADKVMIRQLINIILENAIKYTGSDKKIKIKITAKRAMIEIRIQDNGIGISKKDLNHIFDKFWRAESSRHQKGLGLGLSLAETIVNIHKGSISVSSEVGKGTEFIINLPKMIAYK